MEPYENTDDSFTIINQSSTNQSPAQNTTKHIRNGIDLLYHGYHNSPSYDLINKNNKILRSHTYLVFLLPPILKVGDCEIDLNNSKIAKYCSISAEIEYDSGLGDSEHIKSINSLPLVLDGYAKVTRRKYKIDMKSPYREHWGHFPTIAYVNITIKGPCGFCCNQQNNNNNNISVYSGLKKRPVIQHYRPSGYNVFKTANQEIVWVLEDKYFKIVNCETCYEQESNSEAIE